MWNDKCKTCKGKVLKQQQKSYRRICPHALMGKLDSRLDADCTASSQTAPPCNPSQISCKHFHINGADTKCHKVKVSFLLL